MQRFTTVIRKVGINPCVDVPAKISREYARRGYVPVVATLGGRVFQANLVPVGGGRHRLYLNQPMRTAADRETGERITVELAVDTASRVLRMPADLARALKAAGRGNALATIVPSHRKEIIRWVTAARTPGTRQRRITKVVAHFPRTPYRE